MVRNLWGEFKTFAFKGNMIDLAVAVIIGAAFGKLVASLVDHVFMPLIAAAVPNSKGVESIGFTVNGSRVALGMFLGAVINFLIVALAVFLLIVKIVGAVVKKTAGPPPAPGEPTVKECPLCLSEIPIKARRCKYCAGDLPAEGVAAASTGALPM
jgi:large conductance mechanosensitive channel